MLCFALLVGLFRGVAAEGPGIPGPSPVMTRPPAGIPLAYPGGCAAYQLSPHRCDYIVQWAREQAGYGPADPVEVELLGDPACADGTVDCFVARTQSFVVRVRFTGPDRGPGDQSIFCGVGGGSSLLCTDAPVIRRSTPTTNGYRDVPCSGEAPDGCASPVPSAAPTDLAAAQPLQVSALRIPIDHIGAYSIVVGDAVLPNGLLTEATFGLADESPTDTLVTPEGMSLVIRSLDGGAPFESIYEHGWHTGTERVRATLVFEVESFEPGAVLVATDIAVR